MTQQQYSQIELPDELIGPQLFRFFLAQLFNWSIIVISLLIAGHIDTLWGYIISAIIIGTRLHAFGLLGHDGAHKLLARNKRLNDALTCMFCMWPAAISLGQWRRFHFGHHRHHGTPLDPELMGKQAVAEVWQVPMGKHHILVTFVKDILCLGILDALKMKKASYLKHTDRKLNPDDRFGPLAWYGVGTVSLVSFDLAWIIPVWLYALLGPAWAFSRLRLWSEHVGTTGTHRISASWWQRFFFLPHNTWCHYEHHLHGNISWSNLPSVRKLYSDVPVIPVSQVFHEFSDQAMDHAPLEKVS